MKQRLRIWAACLAVLALFTLAGTIPLAADAGPTKGFRGFVCDDHGKPVGSAKVTVNLQPLQADSEGGFFVPHEKLKYDRTVFLTVEATFENAERNPPYRWDVDYARVFDYASGAENVTVRPRVPGALAGRVLTTDGKPIAGAAVSAHISVGLLNCHGTHPMREVVQTEADGRFRVPKLYADNDYLLRIEAPGYERKWTEWVRVRSGEPAPVNVRLRDAPAAVAGKVVDAQGEPIANARVMMGHLCIPDAVAKTDAEGRFRIANLLPGQDVELWANGKTLKTKAGTEDLLIVAP